MSNGENGSGSDSEEKIDWSSKIISELEFCLNLPAGSIHNWHEFGKEIVLDSLDDYEILLAMETIFNVELDPSVWSGVSTVGDLVDSISSRLVVSAEEGGSRAAPMA